jgi:hypothetical protein
VFGADQTGLAAGDFAFAGKFVCGSSEQINDMSLRSTENNMLPMEAAHLTTQQSILLRVSGERRATRPS